MGDTRLACPHTCKAILPSVSNSDKPSGNAIKFTNSGEVALLASPAPKECRYEMSLSGHGHRHPQRQGRASLPPVQAERQIPSKQFTGTVLGLFISKQLSISWAEPTGRKEEG